MSWQRTLAATAHITMHPAQLVGKQRPMTDYRNHRTYTPTKTLKAEKAIKDAFRAAYGETFANHDGPVVMRISTTRPLAKSTGRAAPTSASPTGTTSASSPATRSTGSPSRTTRRSTWEPSPSARGRHTAPNHA